MIGDLELTTDDDGFRVMREPRPWSTTFGTGSVVGTIMGALVAVLTGKNGADWALAGFFIMFWCGLLGTAAFTRRKIFLEVRRGVLVWQDTGRLLGRSIRSIDLKEIDSVTVNRATHRLELGLHDGKVQVLLPGVMEPALGVVGHLLERQVRQRPRRP